MPVDIGSDESISEITMGALSICVRLSDGSVKCWGDGSDGTLGSGNTEDIGDQLDEMGDNLLSVDLGANFAASDIDCFGAVCCAVSQQGKVKCWGRARHMDQPSAGVLAIIMMSVMSLARWETI